MPEELPIHIKILEYDKLKEIATTNKLRLKEYANQLIVWKFERDDIRSKMFPDFKRIAYVDGIFYIHDKERNDTAQISLKKDRLECNLEESTTCDHVLFAYLCDDFPLFMESFK